MVIMLPSNASQDLYPENTSTNYKFELPSCVVMNGRDFKVALTSFTYPDILLDQGHLSTTDNDWEGTGKHGDGEDKRPSLTF